MTKPYKHKLTKKDLKHLKKFDKASYRAIEKQMRKLVRERKCDPGYEPCFECKSIARKLGLSV